MNTSKTNEQAFEALIEKALVGSTIEERKEIGQTDVDVQTPDVDKYYWGKPSDVDPKLSIDMRRLWSFLESSQPEELAKYVGKDLHTELSKQLSKLIATIGIVDVLRKGLDFNNMHLTLFY